MFGDLQRPKSKGYLCLQVGIQNHKMLTSKTKCVGIILDLFLSDIKTC